MTNKHYQAVYEGFKMYHGVSDEEVTEWWPVGRNTIKVALSNGSRIEYHHLVRSMRPEHEYISSEDEWRKEFARRLYFEMFDRGISQAELSERSGITQQSISNYLNRKVTPSAYAVECLARAMMCYIDDLIPPIVY